MIEYAYTARKNYRPRRIAKIESVNSVKKKKDYFKIIFKLIYEELKDEYKSLFWFLPPLYDKKFPQVALQNVFINGNLQSYPVMRLCCV